MGGVLKVILALKCDGSSNFGCENNGPEEPFGIVVD